MRIILLLAAVVLAGCAARTQYVRADGQIVSQSQIDLDEAECSAQSEDHYCMVGKGYFTVVADQADAKRAQLAAIAQTNEQMRQAQLAAQAAAEAKKAAEAKRRARQKKKQKQKVTAATPNSPWH